jgi:hypothetical protein
MVSLQAAAEREPAAAIIASMGSTYRYSTQDATRELRQAMRARGVLQKQLAAAIGASDSSVSQKFKGAGRNSFSLEELGLAADFLRAPSGWPFISWEEGELLDAARKLAEGMARKLAAQ